MSERPNSGDPLDANRDAGFIPQIFNYCDRWCERCAFTLRCRVYAMEADMMEDESESADAVSEFAPDDFALTAEGDEDGTWPEELADSDFREPVHDLRSDPEGDEDLEAPTEFQEAEATLRDRAAHERGGSFVQSAEAYAWRVKAFLDEHPELSDEDIATLVQLLSSRDAHPAEIKGCVVRIADALETIMWYPILISGKLRRAFLSQVDELVEDHLSEPRDSEGSAKVALLAIDQSLAAWATLGELLPMHAEVARDCHTRLQRLMGHIEEMFPGARAFVRPGFDE